MNTYKATQLGDFLSLFNYPQPGVAQQPMGPPGMPVVYAQQMPAGQVASAAPPQGMVQLSAAPVLQPEPQLTPMHAPQYAPPQQPMAPQVQPPPQQPMAPQVQPPASVPAVNIGQPANGPAPVSTDDLVRQNEAYRLQLAQQQTVQTQQAAQQREAELAALKPMERLEARIQSLTDQNAVSTERANQWWINSARKDIELQHNGRINSNHLDNSSIEALQASVPRALASYAEMENSIEARIRQEIGMNSHRAVENLPPAPGMVGLPASNRGGSIPQGPPQMGYQPGEHPMMQNNYLQYTPNAAHGRVYQPQWQMPAPAPVPGGQMFPPQYPQPPYAQQQQQQQYASPPVQLVPQSQMGQQPQYAPGMPQQNVEAAKATARASILAARKGGSAALAAQGLREPSNQTQALSMQGGAPNHAVMPDPTAFSGGGAMHPMHLASNGM